MWRFSCCYREVFQSNDMARRRSDTGTQPDFLVNKPTIARRSVAWSPAVRAGRGSARSAVPERVAGKSRVDLPLELAVEIDEVEPAAELAGNGGEPPDFNES